MQRILNGTFLAVIAVAPTLVGKTATSTCPDAIIGTIVDGSVTVSKFSVIANAAKCLKTGKNLADESKEVDYVLLAEPALTNVLKTTPTASLYEDLQSKYKEKSGGLILPQASVFVKTSLDQEIVMEGIYEVINLTVNQMIEDTSYMTTFMNKVDDPEVIFGVKPEIAAEVTENGNKMGLGVKLASSIKDDINNFLKIFGVNELTDENIA